VLSYDLVAMFLRQFECSLITLLPCFYGNLSDLSWSCRVVFPLRFTATRLTFSLCNVFAFSPPLLSVAASWNDVPVSAHAADPNWVAH